MDLRKKVAEMREWDEEELRMLDRALAKFPQVGARGTRRESYACYTGRWPSYPRWVRG